MDFFYVKNTIVEINFHFSSLIKFLLESINNRKLCIQYLKLINFRLLEHSLTNHSENSKSDKFNHVELIKG